jgi:hypothetical protein
VTSAQILVANLIALLLLVALVGLIVRGKARLWWSFTVLLIAALSGNVLTRLWPPLLADWNFWAFRQALYSGLYMAMAIELALKLFSDRLPRARFKALLLASIASIVTAAVVSIVADGSSRTGMAAVIPTLRAGAVWLLALLLVLAVYYHLPIHAFHRVIIVGAALYHCTFVGLSALVGTAGWHMVGAFNALDPAFYATTVGLWAYAAWRPEPAPALTPATATLLQPWAAR